MLVISFLDAGQVGLGRGFVRGVQKGYNPFGRVRGLLSEFAFPSDRLFPLIVRAHRSYPVQVNVSARHGHLKAEDQAIIVEKVEKVRRLFDRINAIEVTVDLEHLDKPSVEINVSAEHAPDFVASTQSQTILAALDLTIGKVEQQIRKHKEKVTEHKATGVKHSNGETV